MVVLSHGTRKGYQRGCRCLVCRAAEARYRAEYRQRALRAELSLTQRVPPGRARELLQRLTAAGLKGRALCRRLGLAPHGVGTLSGQYVTRKTECRLHRVWREVSAMGPDEGD